MSYSWLCFLILQIPCHRLSHPDTEQALELADESLANCTFLSLFTDDMESWGSLGKDV